MPQPEVALCTMARYRRIAAGFGKQFQVYLNLGTIKTPIKSLGEDLANSTDSGSEKRIEPRAPIELKVEYRRLNTFFADYTKNISKGGTFIKTRKPLKIGTEFVFKLFVPSLDDPISLNGKVQWIVNPGEEEPGEHPGMGIKFEYEGKAGQEKKKQVETTVEKLIVDSLGRHLYKKLINRNSSEPESA